MPFAPVNGISLYYEIHGSGFPIVFLHGRGGNHLSWWQQVPFFSPRYQCIVIDQREFGQSTEVKNGPGRSAFVQDLRDLLDHLHVDRTYIVGQSMGGGTALGFALLFPERTAGVVLADTSGGIAEEEILSDFRRRALLLPQDASQRAISEGYRRRDPAGAFLYAEIGRLSPPVRETFEQYLTADDGPRLSNLAGFSVPSLVIVGSNDVVITPDMARLVSRYIPGAHLEIVADAGHSVYFERPKEFNHLVSDFFSEIEAKKVHSQRKG